MEVKVGHNSLRHIVEGRELLKITSEREKQGAETELNMLLTKKLITMLL